MEILEFADYLNGEVNVRCRVESATEKRTASSAEDCQSVEVRHNLLRSVTIC